MKMAPTAFTKDVATEKDNLKSLTRKHIAERQRRARINKLLEQLESLVMPQDNEGQINSMKLEKAEVLERTVEFVKKIKRHNKNEKNVVYTKGYTECMNGVKRFIDNSELESSQRMALQSFLSNHGNVGINDINNNISTQHIQRRHCESPLHQLPVQCTPQTHINQTQCTYTARAHNGQTPYTIIPSCVTQATPVSNTTSYSAHCADGLLLRETSRSPNIAQSVPLLMNATMTTMSLDVSQQYASSNSSNQPQCSNLSRDVYSPISCQNTNNSYSSVVISNSKMNLHDDNVWRPW